MVGGLGGVGEVGISWTFDVDTDSTNRILLLLPDFLSYVESLTGYTTEGTARRETVGRVRFRRARRPRKLGSVSMARQAAQAQSPKRKASSGYYKYLQKMHKMD